MHQMGTGRQLILYATDKREKETQLRMLCGRLHISMRKIKNSDANTSIATLAGINLKGRGCPKGRAPKEYQVSELLIFSGLTDQALDTFLAEYKKDKIEPIGLKAIITPHNLTWSVYELEKELQRERIAMMFGKK